MDNNTLSHTTWNCKYHVVFAHHQPRLSNAGELPVTLATVMGTIMEETPPAATEDVIHHAEGVDLMPASIELSGVEISLVNAMSRETILRQYIQIVKPVYDYIVLDTSPSLGMSRRLIPF